MDKKPQSPPSSLPDSRSKRQSDSNGVIHDFCHLTARLYALLSRSIIGRCFGGYRQVDRLLGNHWQRSRYRGSAVSRGYLLVAEVWGNNLLISALRWIERSLYELPMRFYGLFMLFYGLFEGILVFARVLLPFGSQSNFLLNLIVAVTLVCVAIPALATPYTMRTSVSKSRFSATVLVGYLCIPDIETPVVKRKMTFPMAVSAIFGGVAAAVCAVCTHPLLVPWGILGFILFSLIFAYPETGALLIVAALPVVWMFPSMMTALIVLILMTWCGYIFRRFLFRRTVRKDILEIVGLLLAILILMAGVGGFFLKLATVRSIVLPISCMSVFFLIARLLNTRDYLKRCLFGLGMTAVLVTLANLLLQIGGDALLYLPSTPRAQAAGQIIEETMEHIRTAMFAMDTAWRGTVCSLLTVCLFPVVCAMWMRARQPMVRCAALSLLGINVGLIVSNGSIGTVLCTAGVATLFFLLFDHRSLAALALCLPTTVGAVGWYWAWQGTLPTDALASLPWLRPDYEEHMARLWQSISTHPVGVGFGVEFTDANLFMEVLAALGWPGLAVSVIFLILLMQKGFTALLHTETLRDRAMTAGLICGIAGFLLYGLAHGFLTEPRAILTLTVFSGLLSIFADLLFEEADVQDAVFLLHSTPRTERTDIPVETPDPEKE